MVRLWFEPPRSTAACGHDPQMRNPRVRFQIDVYTIENDPFAIRRRRRRADALQFHHVFEGEGTLLWWRLREYRGREQKQCCEKTFHKPPSFRLTPIGASSVLGSARLWRSGDRILRSRTFRSFEQFALRSESKGKFVAAECGRSPECIRSLLSFLAKSLATP